MSRSFLLAAGLLCLGVVHVDSVGWEVETPLDSYVNRPDPHYQYYEIATYDDSPDFTVHVLNMTSQKWMDETFTNDSIWWHYLSVFIPKSGKRKINDAAFIHIGNGNWNDSVPTMDNIWMERAGNFCRDVGVVSAYLRTVPYQPTRFVGSRVPRVEDNIIGYTWRVFIEDPSDDPDPDVNLLLPMAKAAKKAIDTVAEFVKNQAPEYDIQKFMPTGYSKRGWTSWLLGCVDKRVFAMAPTVFDLLSMQPNLMHHFRALGGWSWAFYAYWMEGVARYLNHPRVIDMAAYIDPLSFNERLTMPKLIITAAGDQFFPPDDSHYFWTQLTEPKFLQVWENDDHSLANHRDRISHNLQAFFLHSYYNQPFPEISWIRQENELAGRISLSVNPLPTTISAWWADTTNVTCEPDTDGICRRDFRIRTLREYSGIMWANEPVYDLGGGQYIATYDVRDDWGYRGFFIEMTFPGMDGYEMRFTTEINIIPDTLPYPACETEEECQGRLV